MAILSAKMMCLVRYIYLNNYFRLHVCLSFRKSIRPYVRTSHFHFFDFLQLFHKMSLIKNAWHVLRVKDMHLGSPSDPSVGLLLPRQSRGAYNHF